jgi:hypothetical protein
MWVRRTALTKEFRGNETDQFLHVRTTLCATRLRASRAQLVGVDQQLVGIDQARDSTEQEPLLANVVVMRISSALSAATQNELPEKSRHDAGARAELAFPDSSNALAIDPNRVAITFTPPGGAEPRCRLGLPRLVQLPASARDRPRNQAGPSACDGSRNFAPGPPGLGAKDLTTGELTRNSGAGSPRPWSACPWRTKTIRSLGRHARIRKWRARVELRGYLIFGFGDSQWSTAKMILTEVRGVPGLGPVPSLEGRRPPSTGRTPPVLLGQDLDWRISPGPSTREGAVDRGRPPRDLQ